MKRIILGFGKRRFILVTCFIAVFMAATLSGCASSKASSCNEMMKHGSIWKSWDHAYFSYVGYKNPTPEAIKKSIEENWWGCPVEVTK